MIAATTLSEYKEYIQEDEALARRFRCVTVCEPSIEETRRHLHNLPLGRELSQNPLPESFVGSLGRPEVPTSIARRAESNEHIGQRPGGATYPIAAPHRPGRMAGPLENLFGRIDPDHSRARAVSKKDDELTIHSRNGATIKGPAWAVLVALGMKSWVAVVLTLITVYGAAHTPTIPTGHLIHLPVQQVSAM
jgi:hypothetical protein